MVIDFPPLLYPKSTLKYVSGRAGLEDENEKKQVALDPESSLVG